MILKKKKKIKKAVTQHFKCIALLGFKEKNDWKANRAISVKKPRRT